MLLFCSAYLLSRTLETLCAILQAAYAHQIRVLGSALGSDALHGLLSHECLS